MAIYHLHISNVSRANGSSSCATLAYITGERVHDERRGETFQYGRKERVIFVATCLPSYAADKYQSAGSLFNAIEKYEKPDTARTAKKVEVALPRELDLEKQKEVMERYIRETITTLGYACTFAIHVDADGSNPHAHILIANRQIDKKTGEFAKTKTRKEYALDEKGNRIPQLDENGEQKLGKRNEKLWKRVSVQVNPLDQKETLEKLRKEWANECNKYLSQEKKIDHRSYERQGKEQIPTIHEGYAARELERKGGQSDRCEHNRQAKKITLLLSTLSAQITDLATRLKELLEKKDREEWRIDTNETEKPLIDENRASDDYDEPTVTADEEDLLPFGPVKVTEGRSDTSSIPSPTKAWDR